MQLTVRDAARLLNLAERALMEHVEKGGLPSHSVAGRRFLNRDELVEWATARGLPVALPAVAGDESMPTLGAALEDGAKIALSVWRAGRRNLPALLGESVHSSAK